MVEIIKIGMESKLGDREKFLTNILTNSKHEGILLQTCNRVEFYTGTGKMSDEIVRHLFRVISGLESSIIGETAIIGQIKQAYSDARLKYKLDKSLHKLFQTAFFVGKKVRTETGISMGAMSHSQAAVNLLFQKIENVKNANITIIGVNSLNETIIKYLIKKGATTFFIGNRTFSKAQILAEKYNGLALRFDSLPEVLEKTDVLICATSAPHFIISKNNFQTKKEMIILDLAVPRDVDPCLNELPNVKLFDIETIEQNIQGNMVYRADKVAFAEAIIESEVQLFMSNQFNKKSRKISHTKLNTKTDIPLNTPVNGLTNVQAEILSQTFLKTA
jgi:glutamyl-tRNA reductase